MDAPLNLLVAGAENTGKTSLLISLSRGVYLAKPPRRFEGWTLTVPLPDEVTSGAISSPKKNKVLRTRSHGGSSSSIASLASHSKDQINGLNVVLWEDWPRFPEKEETSQANSDSENEDEENNIKRNEENGNGRAATPSGGNLNDNRNSGENKENGLSINGNPLPSSSSHTHSSGRVHHHPLHGTNSNNNNNSSLYGHTHGHHHPIVPAYSRLISRDEESEADDTPPCIPPRPCLSPHPQVIILCFSCDDLDSLVEAETKITPELLERYPEVPIILVANKCDLRLDTSATSGENGNEPRGRVSSANKVSVEIDRRRYWRATCSSPEMTLHEVDERGNLVTKATPSAHEMEAARATAVFNYGDSKSSSSNANEGVSPTNEATPTKFTVTSEMGVAMAKRISANAFIETSSQTGNGLDHIKAELSRILYYGPDNGNGAPSGAAAKLKGAKKHSAPLFLFQAGASAKRRSTAAANVLRSKAASFNFIRGSMSNIYNSAASAGNSASSGSLAGEKK